MSEHVAHRQAIRLGRTVKLTCPVEGDPPALIMWTKDGRNIHSGWSRFRVLPLALRIKAVETEDAGTYVCKAANGFGSVNINYTLIVIGESPILSASQRPSLRLLLQALTPASFHTPWKRVSHERLGGLDRFVFETQI